MAVPCAWHPPSWRGKIRSAKVLGRGEYQLDARFWVYGCFPHDVLREAGERTEDRSVFDGLRGAKKVKGE